MKKIVAVLLAFVLIVSLAACGSGAKIESYMAQGDYENAYNIAKNDESKAVVIAENAVAVCCKDIVSQLINPKSFVLKEAYYESSKIGDWVRTYVVLTISTEFGDGTTGPLYCWYHYDEEASKYTHGSYLSDLTMDDDAIQNTQKKIISDTMTSSNKLSDGCVTRINNLFANDQLDTVSLLVASKEQSSQT